MKLCDLFENYRDDTREKYADLRPTEYDSMGRPVLNSRPVRIDPRTGKATKISRKINRPTSNTSRVVNTGSKDPQVEIHEEQLKAISRSITNAFDTLKLDIMVGINREKAKQAIHGMRPGELSSEFTVEMNKAYDAQMRKIKSDQHSNEIYNYVYKIWRQNGSPVGSFIKEYRSTRGVGRWGGNGYYRWTFENYQKFREATGEAVYEHFRMKYLKDFYKAQDEIDQLNNQNDQADNLSVQKIPNFNIPKTFSDKRSIILDIWNDYKNHKIDTEQAVQELSSLGLSNNMIMLLLNSDAKS